MQVLKLAKTKWLSFSFQPQAQDCWSSTRPEKLDLNLAKIVQLINILGHTLKNVLLWHEKPIFTS